MARRRTIPTRVEVAYSRLANMSHKTWRDLDPQLGIVVESFLEGVDAFRKGKPDPNQDSSEDQYSARGSTEDQDEERDVFDGAYGGGGL